MAAAAMGALVTPADAAPAVEEEKFFFEGVEKVLEIDFAPGMGPERGLRELTRAQLDGLCEAARCTIIATMSNEHLDSYVLSESSLFVYPTKMILKTCGTTTLLMCLEPLLEATTALGMRVEWVAYTRKDFQRPGQQKFPHRDPSEEAAYLSKFFPEGHAFVLGPLTADHWVVFVADYVDRPTDSSVDRTLDMMMFGIDEDVAKLFVKDAARFPKDSDVTKASGIDTLLAGSLIQEFCFDPCGYSMNGLLYDAYWTIHITPESHCSYASFETNMRMPSYQPLIKAVLAIFRPRKWTMTLFADQAGLRAMRESPFASLLAVPVVESTSRAIAGPCVLTRDRFGNTSITMEGLATPRIGGSVISPSAYSAGTGTPVASSPSVASAAAAAAATAAPAVCCAPPSADDLAAALVASAMASATSPTAATSPSVPPVPSPTATAASGGCGGSATEESKLAPPVKISVPGEPATRGTSTGGRMKGALSYLMSTKSQTEFIGEYTALLGNFTLLHAATVGTTSRSALAAAAEAAKDVPATRAKYVVAKRVQAMQNRVRTESY